MAVSVLSEFDVIQSWLNTPEGYYVDKPTYGNNLYILLFKTKKNLKMKLHLILDKIEYDLGFEIANTIDEIILVKVEQFENFKLVIRYNFDLFATADIILEREE